MDWMDVKSEPLNRTACTLNSGSKLLIFWSDPSVKLVPHSAGRRVPSSQPVLFCTTVSTYVSGQMEGKRFDWGQTRKVWLELERSLGAFVPSCQRAEEWAFTASAASLFPLLNTRLARWVLSRRDRGTVWPCTWPCCGSFSCNLVFIVPEQLTI